MTGAVAESTGPTARLAQRVGWTEGQLQTALLGTGLAVLLTLFGLGPALGDRPLAGSPLAQPAGDAPGPAVAAPPADAPPAEVALPPAPPPDALPPIDPLPLAPFEPGLAALPPADPAPAFPTAEPFPLDPGPAAPTGDGVLTLTASAWYTDDAGTPLTGTVDPVPEGGLPVAARGTRVSRLSALQLGGDPAGTRLTLPLADGGQRFEDRAGVQLCPVLDAGFEPGPAQPLAEAPAFDGGSCVAGERGEAAWTFDLARFPVRTGGAGFALVPVADPQRPLFQVTYASGGTGATAPPGAGEQSPRGPRP